MRITLIATVSSEEPPKRKNSIVLIYAKKTKFHKPVEKMFGCKLHHYFSNTMYTFRRKLATKSPHKATSEHLRCWSFLQQPWSNTSNPNWSAGGTEIQWGEASFCSKHCSKKVRFSLRKFKAQYSTKLSSAVSSQQQFCIRWNNSPSSNLHMRQYWSHTVRYSMRTFLGGQWPCEDQKRISDNE